MPRGERLSVGYVAGVHGTRGLVRIQLHDPESTAVRRGVEIVLVRDAEALGRHLVEDVDAVPGKAGRLRVRLRGVDDRDQAEALRGSTIEVERAELPPLDEDEFYLADAIGLAVRRVDESGAEQELGRVVGVTSNGPQDLFEVQWRDSRGRSRTWLLPVLPQFLRDMDTHRILVDVPEEFLPEALESRDG